MSAPAILHHHLTTLESIAMDFTYVVQYLNKAYHEQDPIERLKLISTGFIASQHVTVQMVQCRTLINASIGATAQRILPTGEKFYAE